ncbi:YjbE family putative metal transport protein [Sphingorhabdus sp.]|jgi:YjbE family integral membrane protein|uniref:YjbE family putative metal transport protein n=2 Tax=Sphingorhabdus sp. TaxID=1902408 RepID=UPI00261D7038|nr:YjbE family putative metal transport protein [Sphingorhabdus sp.]MDH4399971.1 YjbE family putative metal transport protein [Sphingorhabdus sp.]
MMLEFLIATASAAPSLGGPAEIWGHIVNDFSNLNSSSAWTALASVILLDLVLAGDNAIVVGALAAGLPPEQRKKVIFIGVIAALVLRVVFALMVNILMGVIGLIFVGGLLLIWVAWKMYRDLKRSEATESPGSPEILGDENSGIPAAKSFAAAAWAVAVADVSMSLDNVLAVAGAAKDHPGIMIVGLIFAVALMGIAANVIAQYIERYKWIAWFGMAVIVYVAGKMIYEGWTDPDLGVGRYVIAMIGG